MCKHIGVTVVIVLLALAARAADFNVRNHGAAGDGETLDTTAIQAAVDACHEAGGGRVLLDAGTYRTGTVFLKSGVTLHLVAGAVLRGSTALDDYPVTHPDFRSYTDNYTERSLIYAERAENTGITGHGVIDGSGAEFEGEYKVRPYMIRSVECRDVAIEDVTLRNSAMWTMHLLGCDNVRVNGVTIRTKVNKNNDGLDVDCSKNVRIANCDISSGDDAIVLKSTAFRATENVVITNCVLNTDCNALKMGTESNGGFKNITINNCVIYDTRLAGLALEIVDGGTMDQVAVSNITMNGVGCPIFIRLGNRARPPWDGAKVAGVGTLRNVSISNIEARALDTIGCSITGLPGHPVENITLRDVRLTMPGGKRSRRDPFAVPQHEAKYPEYSMFGSLPSYGFFIRHAENLRLDGITLRTGEPDARQAIICDDVNGLSIDALKVTRQSGRPDLLFRNVRHGQVRAAWAGAQGDYLLGLAGDKNADVLVPEDARVSVVNVSAD
ncbi:MAG: glycoside hydrolase family 28 protein [Candidatus Hydrogenedentota bacterium]